MNEKLENFKKELVGKRIDVIGLGISNISVISYLLSLNIDINIYVRDENENSKEKLSEEFLNNKKLHLNFGSTYLDDLDKADYIFRSPGIKPFLPQIENAVRNGSILTSEIEQVVNLAPCKIIGITGSAGKTTTTTLVSEFLKKYKHNVYVGGNIGTPLFDKLDKITKDDLIVLELSSFQLMTMRKSPNYALITNIYEDHLDYHRDFEEYVSAKENIFIHQKKDDLFVINKDDKYYDRFLGKVKGKVLEFSENDNITSGAFFKNGKIYLKDKNNIAFVVDVNDLKIIGNKNYLNICSAICLVKDFVDIEDIKDILIHFRGVEHRLEFVDIIDNVSYYNDSISTTPGKAIAALTSFDKKIILIAGGSDKNLDYTPLGKYIVKSSKYLILLGATSKKIKEAVLKVDKNFKIKEVSNLKEAIYYSKEIAKEGDIVVMSPASASFDMYKNYKQRGKEFKEIVLNLNR